MNFSDQVVALYPAMLSYAKNISRGSVEAEDLVQSSMIKLLQYEKTFDGNSLTGLAFTILRNEFFTLKRRSGRTVELPQDYESLFGVTTTPALLADEVAKLRALDQQNASILLLLILGYAYEDIGDIVSLPTGTIKSRAFRTRKRLAEMPVTARLRPQPGEALNDFLVMLDNVSVKYPRAKRIRAKGPTFNRP